MKWGKRILILICIFGGLSWPVVQSVKQQRHEAAVRSMLLNVQEALQDYHVDQEKYIPRDTLSGAELIGVLLDFGFLAEPPMNPWTGTPWALDGEEPDFLRYESSGTFETYALKALDVKTEAVLMEIDSVEHLSLE